MSSNLRTELYASVSAQNKPRQIEHWHASSIAKCPAALYLERKGVPPLPENKPGAGKILRWEAGHAIEAAIRPHLQSVYPQLVTNVRFTNEVLELTGEFDAYDPETKTLISVKSVHDFAMLTRDGRIALKEDTGATNARGNKMWDFKNGPYIHHEWQEHAYVLLLSDPDTQVGERHGDIIQYVSDGYPVEQIAYVYITLGGIIDTYTTPVKPEILKRVADKVNYLNQCWTASTLPLCLCREGQEMFKETNQYCDFRTQTGCCAANLIEEGK